MAGKNRRMEVVCPKCKKSMNVKINGASMQKMCPSCHESFNISEMIRAKGEIERNEGEENQIVIDEITASELPPIEKPEA